MSTKYRAHLATSTWTTPGPAFLVWVLCEAVHTGGEGGELVLEAGWGLTTKGTGSRHGWAGHPISCDVDLTVPASPLGGAEHRQALEVSTVGLGGRALTVPETS